MANSDPIAWRDIVGEVSLHFCASDWETVRELVLEVDVNPLPRCNVARASFDLREDFEALLNRNRPEPDQTELEQRFAAEARETLAAANQGKASDQARVEASVVLLALEDLDQPPTA